MFNASELGEEKDQFEKKNYVQYLNNKKTFLESILSKIAEMLGSYHWNYHTSSKL